MKRKASVPLASILPALVVAGAVFAGGSPLAQVRFSAWGIDFEPEVAAAGYLLTVTGPEGFVYREEFYGVAPYFSLSDQAPVDGLYRWELRAYSLPKPLVENRDTAWRRQSEVQSGHFTIRDGALVDPDVREEIATKDILHLDDVIVDGSLCVGFDCVNGESFGFDTIRLKENNLRIRFHDTSNSASFPTNDWQITANESSNGGANKFSIDDIDGGRTPFTIEASAPSHSLYVDDGGRVGLGTSTPVADLHVKSGNTPTLRLEQDGNSGFTPQTWDVAGNEANFFIRDTTNGSKLVFRIHPGAPSDSIFIKSSGDVGIGTVYIEDDGDVGIGTDEPLGKLHIKNTADEDDVLVSTDGKFGIGTVEPLGKLHIENTAGDDVDDVLVSTDGQVGIGTTNPLGKLHIENTAGNDVLVSTDGKVGIGTTNPLGKLHIENTAGDDVDDVLVSTDGKVGIGTTSPDAPLHVKENAGGVSDVLILENTDGIKIAWVETSGNMEIKGTLTTTGKTCDKGCDLLFHNEVESIEEHAAFMWENSYLRGVGPTPEGQPMNLSEKTAGLLNELEKAHIYIEQLNERLKELQARLEALEETQQ